MKRNVIVISALILTAMYALIVVSGVWIVQTAGANLFVWQAIEIQSNLLLLGFILGAGGLALMYAGLLLPSKQEQTK